MIIDKPCLTKAGLAGYYLAAAPLILPDLANRPLSLLLLPEGMARELFFQKHPGRGSRAPGRQTAEVHIRIALLNRFNALGTAEIKRVS